MNHVMITSTTVLTAVLAAALGAQQGQVRDARTTPVPAVAGTGVLSGTVVSDTADPQPLRRAIVTVSPDDGQAGGRMAITDDAGRFVVGGLPPARYLVTAAKPAYLGTGYGSTRPLRPGSVRTGVAVPLADGQHVNGLTLRMMKSSVITGVVRDAEGLPARGIAISVMYFARAAHNGERTLTRVPGQDGILQTDSRGMYRIFGLPPGDYIVSVIPTFADVTDVALTTVDTLRRTTSGQSATVAEPRVGLVPIYYPGTAALEAATPITLGPSQEREGIDFSLQFVSNVTVTGTVAGVTGAPVAGATVRHYLRSGSQSDTLRATTTTDAQGKFIQRGVAPGSYQLAASMAGGWGVTALEVSGADVQATVRLEPTVTLRGTIVATVKDGAPPMDMSRARLRLVPHSTPLPVPANAYTLTPKPDGAFFADVMPGRYRVLVTAPGDWMLKSATFGAHDVADDVLEVKADAPITSAVVTLTQSGARLSGRMIDSGGLAAPEYFVILFPADRTLWGWQARRIHQLRPGRDGAFAFQNLPAGDYLLAAVTDVDQNEWFDSEFLTSLSGSAIAISLAEHDRKTQAIQVK